MLRIAAILLLNLLALCCSALSQTPSSESDPVFHVSVDLVVLDTQVLNKKTYRPVTALKPEDFELLDNGVEQTITSLGQDTLPLSIVFLFDLTDSVRPVLKPLARGALLALEHLKPEDEAAVMVYSSSAQLLQDFTTDHELIVKAIQKASSMESPEAAFFNEGIFQAAKQSTKAKISGSRRVIIWLTDNIPNIPSDEIRWRYARSLPPDSTVHTQRDTIAELFKTGAVICTLLQRSRISDDEFSSRLNKPTYLLESNMYPPGDVYKYSEQTGGQVIESTSRKAISEKLAELIDEIRGRYALSYHPSGNLGKNRLHTIQLKMVPEVEKREGKLIVRTRRGYYR